MCVLFLPGSSTSFNAQSGWFLVGEWRLCGEGSSDKLCAELEQAICRVKFCVTCNLATGGKT